VAFDLPTQMGYDSDDARALGEVGKVGVAIDSAWPTWSVCSSADPARQSQHVMTINAPALILLAMYVPWPSSRACRPQP
jgi:methylmalonyl-CoA mutase N-terminal domain/subunit